MFLKKYDLCNRLNRSLNDDRLKNLNKFPIFIQDNEFHERIVKFILWSNDYDINAYEKEDILNGSLLKENIQLNDNIEIYAYLKNGSFVSINGSYMDEIKKYFANKSINNDTYNDL